MSDNEAQFQDLMELAGQQDPKAHDIEHGDNNSSVASFKERFENDI